MNTLFSAVDNLISEYDTLDGQRIVQAPARRALAMEKVTASVFGLLNSRMDPWHWDDVDEDIAAELLGYAVFISDLLTVALLDYRERAALHKVLPEKYTDRLRTLLLDIISIAVQELIDMAGPEEPDSDR